ncbi:heat-inducible transcription repressor HrcA [Candidatus Magnetoovum chiemensis]|nr:heat-inducible transcription repressor HrcA [Candidatus Magnetoovum chiemensis]
MLTLPDFDDIKKIKSLAKAVEDKHRVIKLLDRIIETEGVQVYIGSENPLDNMELSLVASSFCKKGCPLGVIALIGPKRMDYLSAISIIDTSAKFISEFW